MAATMDDTTDTPPADQLAIEHGYVDDIGAQLINIESIQQTIRTQVWKLEKRPTGTTVSELKSLLPRLDSLQRSLRKTFAAHARPLIEKLHLFHLPDELLMKIAEDVRGDFNFKHDNYSIAGIKGIKDLRLTCSRLCHASSHLLLYRLDVSLTTSSLNYLDEVSRHPQISTGIRSLHIRAGLFHPTPANDLQSFIAEVLRIMRQDHQCDLNYLHYYADEFEVRTMFEASNLPSPADYESLCETVDRLGKRQEMIRSYTNFLITERSRPDLDQNMGPLRQAYNEYCWLHNNQMALLLNGTFVQRIAQAVAKMPTVAGLTIIDFAGFELRSLPTEMSGPIYASVQKALFTSKLWDPEMISLLHQRPVPLLYQLPLALIRAGNRLTVLRICLKSITDYKMRLSEELAKDLVSGAEHLQVLDIDCQLTVQAFQSENPDGQVSESKLASLFLSGKSLRSVTLRFGSSPNPRPGERSSLEPFLAMLPWANLKFISLVYGSFRYREISEHLEKLLSRTYILLDGVHLLSGLWADLLDVLRAKANRKSDVLDPTGDEDQRLDHRFRDQFYKGNRTKSPAAAYIRRQISENPLRSRPA